MELVTTISILNYLKIFISQINVLILILVRCKSNRLKYSGLDKKKNIPLNSIKIHQIYKYPEKFSLKCTKNKILLVILRI